ncbi:SLC13 family permease [Sporosarcina sp. Marseille-Q4943]|uniref:SLC13 family permease n=1 Tax=Sporosarcina sp. Marseille-Q4943 TaxID=2942204 RepID=UPI00208DA5CE|nr:SLC13 family permease [Sporosarcina sp. Marseille-Q4943]
MITRMNKRRTKESFAVALVDRISTATLGIISVHVFYLMIIASASQLGYAAKVSLFAFLSAMTLWVATKIPAGFVAVSLLLFIVLCKAGKPDLLYNSLSEEIVWLMVGSFIIGEAVKQSGLATRFVESIVRYSSNKNRVLGGVSSALFASAFFIPSTSGRAALSMPMLQQLRSKFSAKEQSVLAIMAPVVILMSTSATLIGAGSHLIGIGLLETTVGQSISFVQWLIWGVPFALIITIISVVVIKLMLWPKEVSNEFEATESGKDKLPNKPFGKNEKKTLVIIFILMAGWLSESIHGYDIAFITMLGAVLVMLPNYGVITWKQGIKSVSWNLILFVAAATALGQVLVDSGVVSWIEKGMFSAIHLFSEAPEWMLVSIILLVTVTSHLYITSHTTRAIVFIPSFIVFSQSIGMDPAAVVFLSLIGMNYCITVPVSSKALLLFYEEGEVSYDAKQLAKVSSVLMPIYLLVMLLFYFTYWQWTGLHL